MARHWIQGAIKHPGALHEELHVPKGKKIPKGKLEAAAKKGGVEGRRARLAETLEGLHHHEDKAVSHSKHRKHHEKEHEKKRGGAREKEHEGWEGSEGRRASGEAGERKERSSFRKAPGVERSRVGGKSERDLDHGKTTERTYEKEAYDRREEGPVKVPPSNPWPQEGYVGRKGVHSHKELNSNGLLSRHFMGKNARMGK